MSAVFSGDASSGGGGGTPHMKGGGMPKGDRSGRGPSFF